MNGFLSRAPVRHFVVTALVLAAIILSLPIALTPSLRGRLTRALSERFESNVELDALRVSLLPHLHVSGSGVVLRYKGRTDVPPLITIASFDATASLWGVIGRPVHLKDVHVEGLEINIPPGGVDLDNDKPPAAATSAPKEPPEGENAPRSPLLVDDLAAERAVLRILRKNPAKAPRVWEIGRASCRERVWTVV